MDSHQFKCNSVQSVLTQKDFVQIVRRAHLDGWDVLGYHVKPAVQGIAGFLGDHFRMVIHLQKGAFTKKLHLFAKFLPLCNEPKAEFISDFNFFKRENLMYALFEDMGVPNEAASWCTKAMIHTDSLLVMPDLAVEGYSSLPHEQCLSLKYVMVAVTSIARFHAKFACYEAKRNIIRQQQKSFYEEHKEVLEESSFLDTPWLRAAAKLTFSLLQEFSNRIREDIDFESILTNLFIKACGDLTVSKDSLNVIIHRDLWMNNIFFRHEAGEPKQALILDFQCVRYAPPAFDLMIFLYLTTSKAFREAHEKEVFNHYYTVFAHFLDDNVKGKLKDYNYGRWDFFNWCERARMFAMTEAMAIFPYVLMAPASAQRVFDDPDTFTKLTYEDRSEPVLAYARECAPYRERQLEVSEEFVDRYILKRL